MSYVVSIPICLSNEQQSFWIVSKTDEKQVHVGKKDQKMRK